MAPLNRAVEDEIRRKQERALWQALWLTLGFMLLEFIGGLVSGSLALLADAGHMLTDSCALGLVLFASWVAHRPPTRRMSYGFHRAEILAALVNGAILITLVIFVIREAIERLHEPRAVESAFMLGVATAGLAVNLTNAIRLRGYQRTNLNIRGAYVHILADFLGSLGVIIAGLTIYCTGWYYADPIASIFIGGLIIVAAWRLLKDAVSVLLEATPAHINLDELKQSLHQLDGVQQVHHLHVWSISTGKDSLSAHISIEPDVNQDELLSRAKHLLEDRFRIFHSTIQFEREPYPEHEGEYF